MITDFNLLRRRLETERDRLMEEFEQLKTNVRPERRESSPYGKVEEEATDAAELERRVALEKHIRDQLTEIEHALHKFDQGTYGVCDFCGQPIEPARLEALPQANLCFSCKARNGKKQLKTDNESEIRQKMGVVHHSRDAKFQPGWEDWFESFEEGRHYEPHTN